MSFSVEVFAGERYNEEVAARIASAVPGEGSVVLTGGTTAEEVYGSLATVAVDWSATTIFFSDERCVPPTDSRSNFGMASRTLLEPLRIERVHRMRGEDPPERAANDYGRVVAGAVARGVELALLGMGRDCHIAAMFPKSPALRETSRMCVPVNRPDGLQGLTLTPPALTSAHKVLLIVSGRDKAEAVRRAVKGDEPIEACPARLLADHAATFLLDDRAASLL